MPDFSTIDNRCLDSWHILISGQFKHRCPLNSSCSKIFDSCKIKRMVTNLTQLGYVNKYDKNRYLENFSKAAVCLVSNHNKILFDLLYLCTDMQISVIESCTFISFEAEKKWWYDKLSIVHCRNFCASPYII